MSHGDAEATEAFPFLCVLCDSVANVLGKTRRVHLVGIGGMGMSGIAELLTNLGYATSGSDEKRSATTDRLAALGVRVEIGHQAGHVGDAEVVVVSSAVRPSNVEVVEARRRRIPVIPRAEMLAELMRLRFSIAVAGAHGKTTTTSMIAVVLERAGLDPTAVIGGRLNAFGSNARLGRGELMVVEADESDRSFLKLVPTLAVITNIDQEHLESYGGFDDLKQAFADFAGKVPFYGSVVACADAGPVREILPRIDRRVITYGLDSADADVRGVDVRLAPLAASCRVERRQSGHHDAARLGELRLNVPGRHNLQNALAAVAVGLELGVPFERVAEGLAGFRGVERRFDVRGECGGVLVVDDYGHHPTEIAAVLAAARTLDRRIVVAFQPHRYSRTVRLLNDFGPSFAGADEVVLTDIYAAGEDPVPGATVEALAQAINRQRPRPVHLVKAIDRVAPYVVELTRPGDVVITLGAGSIGSVSDQVLAALRSRA